MKKVIFYLLAWLLFIIYLTISPHLYVLPNWYMDNLLFAECAYIGGLGGVLYCLRSVYLNKCVQKNWDKDWETWYYLRPLTSTISGFVSIIFIKAGLLVLQASNQQGSTHFGYLAIAFIAGYNVDNFLKKIESVMQAAWGIKKSRSSESADSDKGA